MAGDHGHYFRGEEPDDLAAAIRAWLVLDEANAAPGSWGIKPLRWADAAAQLMAAIAAPEPYGTITPPRPRD